MAASPIQLSLPTGVTVSPEKDDIYEVKIRAQRKKVKEAEASAVIERQALHSLYAQQAKANGLVPANITLLDLIEIIEYILISNSPVTKTFARCEANNNLGKDWAKRARKRSIDKNVLTAAIDYLLHNKGNAMLNLMNGYEVLDVTSMVKSDTYSSGLNKLKNQLSIAKRFKEKDDQLALKDLTIDQKVLEIDKLNTELYRDKNTDWKSHAIDLKKSGVSVADITKRLGKGRTTISTYLNSAEAKKQLP